MLQGLKLFSEKIKSSLKYYIVTLLLLAAVAVNILLLGSNMVSSTEIRQQVSDTNKNMVKLYMQLIDERFYHVERSLVNLLLYDENIITIEANTDNNRMQLAIQGLSSTLTELTSLYNDMDGLLMYNSAKGIMLCNDRSGNPASEKSYLKTYIKESLLDDETTNYDNWSVYQIGAKFYFIRLVRSGVTTVGAYVCVDNLNDKFYGLVSEEFHSTFFMDGEGNPLSMDGELRQSLAARRGSVGTGLGEWDIRIDEDKYIGVEQNSQKGNFSLVGLIHQKDLTAGLRKIQMANGLFFAGIVAAIYLVFRTLNAKISRPVNEIIKAMTKIEDGQWETRLSLPDAFLEFQKIQGQFNEMVGEINQLKIDVYEEKLLKQDAKLRYLQLQLNPHFFLNSLNVIYSLMATRNYEMVKKMVLGLVKHSRYTLKTSTRTVSIQEELEFIHNFIEIQKMRVFYTLDFRTEIAGEVLGFQIPPLILHTFIENSLKYAVHDETVLIVLTMCMQKKEDRDMVYIAIEDSGPGFPPEVFKSMGGEAYIDREGEEHYGITNALQRFWIQYHQEDSILLYNGKNGGACVEIWLPAEKESTGGSL